MVPNAVTTHTQSSPSKRGRVVLPALAFGATVVLAIAVLGSERESTGAAPPAPAAAGASGAAAGPPPLAADAVTLAAKSFDVKVPAVGVLSANESVAIASELSRRVVRVFAQDGAHVKRGQALFQLDDADLLAQRRELAVRRRLLVDNELRQKSLMAAGLSSTADYERSKSELELVDAQSASLAVTIARARITAPFDGRLGLRNVSEGALVSPQVTLVTLHDDTRLKVDFSLPERYAGMVSVGQPFTFQVTGREATYQAKVSAIEPTIEASSRSLKVRGVSDNPGGQLTIGGFVTVELPLIQRQGALLVPAIAIIPSLGGHGVWVAKDGKANLVEVELGVRTESEVEVTRGLAAGDLVLTSNLLRLRPGAPVKVAAVSK